MCTWNLVSSTERKAQFEGKWKLGVETGRGRKTEDFHIEDSYYFCPSSDIVKSGQIEDYKTRGPCSIQRLDEEFKRKFSW
jgi:hypothetical protein